MVLRWLFIGKKWPLFKSINSLSKNSDHLFFLRGDGRRLGRIISARGFTLMEMVITLALFGILLAIAIPSLQSYAVNENLRTAARDLMADFAMAKERAISEDNNYTISFNPGDNQYTIASGVNTQTKSLSTYGASIQSIQPPIPAGVTFQTRGTIDPAGGLTLTNPRGSTAAINWNAAGKAYAQFVMR